MAAGLRLNAPPRRGPWEVLFLGAVALALGGWVRIDRHTLGVINAHRALLPDILVLVGSVLVAFAVTVLARAPTPTTAATPTWCSKPWSPGSAPTSCRGSTWSSRPRPGSTLPTFERCVLPISTSIDVYMVAVALIGIAPRARRSRIARALPHRERAVPHRGRRPVPGRRRASGRGAALAARRRLPARGRPRSGSASCIRRCGGCSAAAGAPRPTAPTRGTASSRWCWPRRSWPSSG